HQRFGREPDPLGDLSEVDERPTASATGNRCQIAITKPVGDLLRLAECGVTCRRITLHDALDGGRNEQESAHDAVEVRLVENTFSSGEPAGCRSPGATLQQAKGKPGGGSSGSLAVASRE